MPSTFDKAFAAQFVSDLDHHGHSEFDELPGWLFKNFVCYIDIPKSCARYLNSYISSFIFWVLILLQSSSVVLVEDLLQFAGGKTSNNLGDEEITHIIVSVGDSTRLRAIRESIQWYFYPTGHVCYSRVDMIIWFVT